MNLFSKILLAFFFVFSASAIAQDEVTQGSQQTAQPHTLEAKQTPEAAQSTAKILPKITLETVLEKYRKRGEEKWEEKIQVLESRNAEEGESPVDSLLFYGSSSFRRWDTIKTDMAPFPAINRGYGGAKYVDMVLFAERMLKPHQYLSLIHI